MTSQSRAAQCCTLKGILVVACRLTFSSEQRDNQSKGEVNRSSLWEGGAVVSRVQACTEMALTGSQRRGEGEGGGEDVLVRQSASGV